MSGGQNRGAHTNSYPAQPQGTGLSSPNQSGGGIPLSAIARSNDGLLGMALSMLIAKKVPDELLKRIIMLLREGG